MKPLNWNTTAEDHEYMAMRQTQNRQRNSDNENWLAKILHQSTHYNWKRQAIWGKRLYDFWNAKLGVAVEVDGPEHNPNYDAYRDEYNFRRSGIVVLRVPNGDYDRASEVCDWIGNSETWEQRKTLIGAGKELCRKPYPPSLLEKFVADSRDRWRLAEEAATLSWLNGT